MRTSCEDNSNMYSIHSFIEKEKITVACMYLKAKISGGDTLFLQDVDLSIVFFFFILDEPNFY